MYESVLGKKPAFFPFVSAEIFFESDAGASLEDLGDLNLESELDELLRT
ncbi:MAG: hypothetical protein LC798_04030 [Chloroflexi bacterium]|nr:hypothetical protein [Chloroflexota bacterium]